MQQGLFQFVQRVEFAPKNSYPWRGAPKGQGGCSSVAYPCHVLVTLKEKKEPDGRQALFFNGVRGRKGIELFLFSALFSGFCSYVSRDAPNNAPRHCLLTPFAVPTVSSYTADGNS